MAKVQSTELAPVASYAIATMDKERLKELLEDNLGGQEFNIWNLPRVVVPTGGGTFWTVGDEPHKAIRGIIVRQQPVRRYYKHGLDTGGEKGPPDCGSVDGRIGVGDPGGECRICPLAEWGSAAKPGQERRGQACKSYRLLVLQPPDRITQTLVMVPPTSLKRVEQWLFELTSKGKAFHRVEVELTLEKETKSGFETAIVVPRALQDVPDDFHREQIAPLVARYRSMMEG